ncbi:sugar nucleotide-binding protein [Tessaracoccus sp. OS52]|uniref:sugar nucleotide-binding protein n=1 Tax=Tessaracoccus sp. OS52 TaxID=2886691 RepID=UPI001D106112|nr:sugar nucleotide-binding protein [Tessaracoccus sp. OS52]MCC2594322.1 sugar nucleotide-binding protein [Tessaracoccus sp. OS52]
MNQLSIETTDIPGLLILHLALQHNEDGWFREGWHRAKMTALGLPDFDPVQHNVTHVVSRGITRGFLAEPWDRIVSVVRGRAMGAWVDLREGEGFGRTLTQDLDPGTAVFVPRGVANAHQVLEDDTTFTYLMEQHWTPQGRSRAATVDLFDPALGINWPIGRDRAIVNHRDTLNPRLADATPIAPRRTLVAGTETQLGRAILAELPGSDGITTAELAPRAATAVDLSAYDVLINAHGDTATGLVDAPVTEESWAAAAERAQRLAEVARRHHLRYVHISTDCVFERTAPSHTEDEDLSLRDAHGQALAAGEVVAAGVPRHLVVRTGWVMGREEGFVEAMAVAARRGTSPSVIGDQHGRLTFASQLAAGITHLLNSGASAGTYNLTGDGRVVSWLEVARRVFQLSGADPNLVREVRSTTVAGEPSPSSAVLDLDRIKHSGFRPGNAWLEIADHLPRPAEHPRPVAVADGGSRTAGGSRPFKVLFVCTANICRSAYADVVARRAAPPGVEFSSAGTRALVGDAIDPPMGDLVGDRGDVSAHRARQLTRELVTDADLILAMASDHRRYILDEWPTLGRKAFVIGSVARAMADLPDSVTLDNLVEHLWRTRTSDAADDVADPYRRGPEAAATAASTIDAHLQAIMGGLNSLVNQRSER